MRISRATFDRAMASAPSEVERIQYVGALLGKATNSEPIIVGGSAIYLLAPSLEPSLDVDIITDRSSAPNVVESWGFVRRNGRVWRREDLRLDIDLLREFRGSRKRSLLVETPHGAVRVACPEDMIVKRLAELKHWPTTPAWRRRIGEQVTVLLGEYGGSLDEEYLTIRARREEVEDLLADFRKNS
ncbi:MAG: hypothetical protein WBG19_02660 [Thermoplasmata archaeon]|nr:hypothetical protein [Thermoplasmata archaeon]